MTPRPFVHRLALVDRLTRLPGDRYQLHRPDGDRGAGAGDYERLGLTNLEFAGIATWFLLAYTASQGISGKLYDRLGTRLGFTLSVLLWSFAEMGHAFATGLRSLSAATLPAGAGARRATGRAPPKRSPSGSRPRARPWAWRFSTVAWPSLHRRAAAHRVAPDSLRMAGHFSRHRRAGAGLAGSLALFYQTPDRHPKLGPAERALILEGRASSPPVRAVRWRDLLRLRRPGRLCWPACSPIQGWWLYLTWLPLYLHNVRGFSLRQIGMFAWAPYVVAAAGSLTGGWLCGHLIARGWSVAKARRAAYCSARRS